MVEMHIKQIIKKSRFQLVKLAVFNFQIHSSTDFQKNKAAS